MCLQSFQRSKWNYQTWCLWLADIADMDPAWAKLAMFNSNAVMALKNRICTNCEECLGLAMPRAVWFSVASSCMFHHVPSGNVKQFQQSYENIVHMMPSTMIEAWCHTVRTRKLWDPRCEVRCFGTVQHVLRMVAKCPTSPHYLFGSETWLNMPNVDIISLVDQ